jgi:probable F420-dependent oxidoreductase
MKDFLFSVACSGAPTVQAWREAVVLAEGLGYDSLLMTDHLHQALAPLPALVAAAGWTTTLRLGTFVLCQDLRNPAVLARELATVDILSEGRLDVGIGAGWLETDYTSAGLTFDSGATRFERFVETATLLMGSISDPAFSFEGRYRRSGSVDGGSRAIQRRVPFLMGAARKKMLTFAATHANFVNITPNTAADFSPEALDEKLEWVRGAAGSRLSEIRLGHMVWECLITSRPKETLAAFASALGCTTERLLQNPSVLLGSPEQVAEQLIERRERWGFTHVTVPQAAMKHFGRVIQLLRGR